MRKYERYSIRTTDTLFTFRFVSQGPKGSIKKLVQYSETNLKDFYNLGFGDETEDGNLDDLVVSDNQDGIKILATVAETVYAFTYRYPDAWIYAEGSTPARTRLYRIGITTNLEEILAHFVVMGLIGEDWEVFTKNTNYTGFLITRKENHKKWIL